MAQLMNRKIWGIQLPLLSDDNTNPYINLGEGKYVYVTWKEFFKFLPTWNIPKTGPRGGETWVNLKDSIKTNKSTGLLDLDFMSAEMINIIFKNTFIEVNEKVIDFEEGSYLIELCNFIKLKNGSIVHRKIRSFKGYDIKFNTNGVAGFSIWRDNTQLEDRIWSIVRAEEAISEMKGGAR